MVSNLALIIILAGFDGGVSFTLSAILVPSKKKSIFCLAIPDSIVLEKRISVVPFLRMVISLVVPYQ
ncbi:hypothetical protein QF042_003884 [Pedobacter sp. W3I1]|nr:hypothetical protein [Pedobacter sp. W3I1]